MHHHRLVLNGPSRAVACLVDELRRAGAVVLNDDEAPRLIWSMSDVALVERMALRHARVAVGVERFEALGSEVVRMVVRDGETTVLDRRRVLPRPEDDELEGWGCPLEEEGAPLEPELLRRAARCVQERAQTPSRDAIAEPLRAGVAVGQALGVLCTTVALAGAAPASPTTAVLDAAAALAATALSVRATSAALAPAEARVEREWALTCALASAGADELWDRPGEAAWSEWLGHLLAASSDVLLACAESVDGGPSQIAAVHREHCASPAEQRVAAAGWLIATGLQALALFDERLR